MSMLYDATCVICITVRIRTVFYSVYLHEVVYYFRIIRYVVQSVELP